MIATPVNSNEQSLAGHLHKDTQPVIAIDNLTELLMEAASYHQAGQFVEAENLYHKILQIDPTQPNANHNLGVLALGADQPKLSLGYFKTALLNNPDDPQFWVSYVDALIKAGERDQAREVLITGLERGLHGAEVNALVNQLCSPQKNQSSIHKTQTPAGTNPQIQQAMALMRAGNLAGAKEKFTRLLNQFPNHAQILTGLGNIALQQGKLQEAVEFYQQSLQVAPNQEMALANLGVCFTNLKRYLEAITCYKKAVQLNPNSADSYFNLGNAQKALKNYQDAAESFQRAIALNPKDAEAYENYAVILNELKKYDESLHAYTCAIRLNKNNAESYYGRGLVNLELGCLENSSSDFKHAIKLNPNNPSAYLNLGVTLHKLGRFEDALKANNVAIQLNTKFTRAYNNRGLLLVDMRRFDEALIDYDTAIATTPESSEAYWNKSILNLLKGDFEQGWPLYEKRWETTLKDYRRSFAQPLWLGRQSIVGKTLLIYPEQGLGDFIQFCRYVPMLEAMGANVILEAPQALFTLMSTLKGNFTLAELGTKLPEFDYRCPIMSLPLALKTTLANIPADLPYLFANESKVQSWQKSLGKKTKPRVGLVWSGSTAHKNDAHRSIALDQLKSLFDLPIEFHVLQKDIREIDTETLKGYREIKTHQAALNDFSDTAALIAHMDLVISVDTSVAHLAAAMGKECWILLPYSPDFRWMLERNDSPWYPSVTLFRQPAFKDWQGVVDKVRSGLQANFSS